MTDAMVVAPSRGAWIEIGRLLSRTGKRSAVAPSRGAWIEIPVFMAYYAPENVAPSRGGVD